MGIRSTFTGNAQTIDISSIADDMLAQVIADHAAQRFVPANRANRQVAGGDITYTVTVDGKVVHAGKGDLFPTNQVAVVVRRTPGRRHSVTVDWLWHKLQGITLSKAITAIGQIDDAITFGRVLANPRGEAESLFWFLWRLYLQRHVSPTTARFLSKAWERSHYLRAAYRFYRRLQLAGVALPGRREADPDVLAWIARELRDRSPVVSGAYRDAHTLFGDGRMIMAAEDITSNTEVPQAKEYSFTNTMPYARKIEFGKTESGRDFVVQVPNRIYERVAQAARAEFEGLADISFEMRSVIDGVQTPQRIAKRQHNRPANRYPSIVVKF